MKLAIQIAAGIAMAVLVIAVGSRLYMEAELRAATQAMAKLNAYAVQADAKMRAQRNAELIGQRAKADALAEVRQRENAAKTQAQAQVKLATQEAAP